MLAELQPLTALKEVTTATALVNVEQHDNGSDASKDNCSRDNAVGHVAPQINSVQSRNCDNEHEHAVSQHESSSDEYRSPDEASNPAARLPKTLNSNKVVYLIDEEKVVKGIVDHVQKKSHGQMVRFKAYAATYWLRTE